MDFDWRWRPVEVKDDILRSNKPLLKTNVPKSWVVSCYFYFQNDIALSNDDHGSGMDTLCQFHQHFTCAFFVQNFGAKNYKTELFALQFFGAKYWLKRARKC